MRKINKGASPAWFEAWKENFRVHHMREPEYKEDFYGPDKQMLREVLVEEQGYICCYCMKRITYDTSHIEHFWPKRFFELKDMDYGNMFASCQGDGDEVHCGHKKEDWYLPDMVILTDPEIEDMFLYLENGEVLPAGKNKTAQIGSQMIEKLALDSFFLTRNRRGAVEMSEVYDDVDYSDTDIRDFIGFYDNKEDGKYIPYCQCIIDCLARQISV